MLMQAQQPVDLKSAIALDVEARFTHNHLSVIENESNEELGKVAGMKSTVAGRIQEGETLVEAMVRELYEETGFKTCPGNVVLLSNRPLHFRQHRYPVFVGHLYVEQEFSICPIHKDVSPGGWDHPEHLKSLTWEADQVRPEVHAVLAAVEAARGVLFE